MWAVGSFIGILIGSVVIGVVFALLSGESYMHSQA
jgi:hypothetical protein